MSFIIESIEDYDQHKSLSTEHRDKFWSSIADHFLWGKKWTQVVDYSFDDFHVEWFKGATVNITENCLDRHVESDPNRIALVFESNDPSVPSKNITYRELHSRVEQCCLGLKSLGLNQGDTVTLYMPMVPEAVVAMLACARLGLVHSVVFAGFSAQALHDRINDAQSKLVITAQVSRRGVKTVALDAIVEEALRLDCPTVEKVVCLENSSHNLKPGFVSWAQLFENQTPTDASKRSNIQRFDAEHPLFVLYTSGSTGKPKGVVHTTGGYMVYTAYTFQNVFQLRPGDIYFCTADIGWITGHSYLVYGPLLCGATIVLYEGIPTYPDPSRLWKICEKHRVTILYTAPTLIRALMAAGNALVDQHELPTLRILGTVGEPINEEAWHWYFNHVGKKRCEIVDTWWQTETGGIMITNVPHITKAKPCYATQPLPGIELCLLDDRGKEIHKADTEGMLCIKGPWPSILRTTHGDHARCKTTYFAAYPGYYFTGDSAKRDREGNYRIIGRVDDVINVSGHRLGTAEIENAIQEESSVLEAAVVGFSHAIKGQAIMAFVVAQNVVDEKASKDRILAMVTKVIGSLAKPEEVVFVQALPKTRSGKIMRRFLRKLAEGEATLGDTSTLLNPESLSDIKLKLSKIRK